MTNAHSDANPLAANFAFSAFVFAGFAWALLAAQLSAVGAGVRAHLLGSSIGGFIFAVAIRRFRRWWVPGAQNGGPVRRSGRPLFRINDLPVLLALAAMGTVLGLTARAGIFTLLVVVATAFSFLPWSRIGFCRDHCYLSCGVFAAVALVALLVGKASQPPIHYMLCAWLVWSIALSELLVTSKKPPASALAPMPAE